MDISKPIPDSVWATLRSLDNHQSVKDAIEVERLSGGTDLKMSIEYDECDGFIVCFYQHDTWMLQQPDGQWCRCYVGHDPEYNRKVLEEKYGLRRILHAYLKEFQQVCPIYI
jgi:hypothetical protein